jgi:hypothetical protein
MFPFPDLRLQQLFGQQQQPEEDINSLFSRLYQPQNDATNAYMEMLNNAPQMQPPSRLQSIAGFLGGLGAGVKPSHISMGAMPIGFEGNPALAAQTSDAITNMPFYREQDNWLKKLKATEPAMTAERNYNVSARQTANEVAKRTLDERKIGETERKNREAEKVKEREVKVREDRAKVYALKNSNPNMKLVSRPGGNLMAFDPATGRMTDTGVDSGTMTEIDKITLQIEGNIQGIQARGEETRKTDAEKPMPEQNGGKTDTLLPSQEKIRIFNLATRTRAKYPEFAKYIKLLPGNIVELDPPSYWGIDKDSHKKIHDEIFGFGAKEEPAPKSADPLGIRK